MEVRHSFPVLLAASVLAMHGAIAQEAVEPQPEAAQTQAAELPRRYVSDKLVLNVYAEPDQASARIATIETGDAVGEIETSGSYARVQLEDGREGWVSENYLADDIPAAVRLRELQDKQKAVVAAVEKKATEEVSRLKKEAAARQAQLDELQAAATRTAAAAPAPPPAARENQDKREPATQPVANHGNAWIWSFALVLAIGAGFAAGYQTLARRIRKRYGGLKIY